MTNPIAAVSAIAILGSANLHAELPQLTEKPFLGSFAALRNNSYQIIISPTGEIVINPIVNKGEVRPYVFIPVEWGIKITDKQGVESELKVLQETLESEQSATDKLDATVIRGKTESGGEVELTVETDRKSVEFKIKLLGTGTLDAATAKAAIFSRVQNYYQREEEQLSGKPEEFEELIKNDWLKVSRIDRSNKKFALADNVNAASDEVTGPGVQSFETELGIIHNTYSFMAGSGAAMQLSNERFIRQAGAASENAVPVHRGYDIVFTAAEEKTKSSENTLEVSFK
ncbi:hypothetical protein [Haloferula sp.]|uniref:hypothetical protein n=1 Tax=Haloferula sp. TaxID=2497595 RepID=UPI003C771D0B